MQIELKSSNTSCKPEKEVEYLFNIYRYEDLLYGE